MTPPTEAINQLLQQVDRLIANGQSEEVEANLYSARLHLQRALREAKGEKAAA